MRVAAFAEALRSSYVTQPIVKHLELSALRGESASGVAAAGARLSQRELAAQLGSQSKPSRRITSYRT
jgi:hypothetical protein